MGRTVLCVDNDRNLCQVLSRALAAEGYDVSTEYDGERALALLEEDPPDLVLLDIMMEDMDGTDVCRAIRRNEKVSHIPVIAFTIIHENAKERYLEIMESGVDEYLTKPFDYEDLEEAIERLLKST